MIFSTLSICFITYKFTSIAEMPTMKYNGAIRGNRLEHRADWMDLKAEFWVKKKKKK